MINDLGGSISGEGGDEGPAEKTAKEIRDLGGEAVPNTDSVATPEGGQAIVQTAVDAYGTVDIVINNAGILRDKSFHNMTPELLDPVIDVHLNGAFYVTIPAWKIMREKNYGRVVNTASNAGVLGNFGQANYGAAKMGLVGLTNVLAIEGDRNNIKVNAIAPVAKTRMTEELLGPLGDSPRTRRWYHRSWRGWCTRTAPSPARSTRRPVAASAASSSASPPATDNAEPHRRGRPRPLGHRSATRAATSCPHHPGRAHQAARRVRPTPGLTATWRDHPIRATRPLTCPQVVHRQPIRSRFVSFLSGLSVESRVARRAQPYSVTES